MLKHISYVSEQAHSLSVDDIEDLLIASRTYNATRNISGILIYFEGVFTQFIEGPEKEIDILYKKILNDKRHKQIRTLYIGNSLEKYYGEWSMTYKTLDKNKVAAITGYRSFDKETFFEPVSKKQDHPGVLLLEAFIEGLHFF